MQNEPFNALAHELQDFTNSVLAIPRLNSPDLRRVLAFIAKVSQVAEQALQDVIAVLVDIKYLTPADLSSSRLHELQKQIELLTMRSRYRDVEEICSRLHHLSDHYHRQIAPLVSGIQDGHGWQGIFGLINEHEGRLIMLVHHTTHELQERLRRVEPATLDQLTHFAATQLSAVREALDQLRELSNQILGLSGTEGLLELTAGAAVSGTTLSVFLNRGNVTMSNDRYEVGQAGAVGPGSHASNINFNQIWNKTEGKIDVEQLAGELTALRTALAGQASAPDHYVAVGEVAAAEKAAATGDGPGALEHLKKAGVWVWDVATKIGIGVATAAAKSALGF
jgi:hypothetical protein